MYQHYFSYNRNITADEWQHIKEASVVAVRNLPLYTAIAGAHYAADPLRGHVHGRNGLIDAETAHRIVHVGTDGNEAILFNGSRFAKGANRDLSYQNFVLTPNANVRDTCRTDRLPYDFLVCAVLLICDHFAPQARSIDSDGDANDWWPAQEFVRKHIHPAITLPDSIDPERMSANSAKEPEKMAVFRDSAEAASSLFF